LWAAKIRESFWAKMLPPLENRVGRRNKLIALSRERCAMQREKIEVKLRCGYFRQMEFEFTLA